uniref:Uncharacterized protein n=1 Tax=Cacopsylla melanoneura TaxID=428564 RepID=A0A8D8PZQ7_9HEMI
MWSNFILIKSKLLCKKVSTCNVGDRGMARRISHFDNVKVGIKHTHPINVNLHELHTRYDKRSHIIPVTHVTYIYYHNSIIISMTIYLIINFSKGKCIYVKILTKKNSIVGFYL